MTKVVPLVSSLPGDRQMASGGMRRIDYFERCRLNGRMPLEIVSHQSAIPRPLVSAVAGGMDADKSTAAPDKSFECRPLVRVQHFPGCVQENDHPVARQIHIGEGGGIFTRVDMESIPFAERADGIDACRNGIVAKARSLAENQDRESGRNLWRLRLRQSQHGQQNNCEHSEIFYGVHAVQACSTDVFVWLHEHTASVALQPAHSTARLRGSANFNRRLACLKFRAAGLIFLFRT